MKHSPLALAIIFCLSGNLYSSIINEQSKFMVDIAKFIIFLDKNKVKVTGGELYRSNEQQKIHRKSGKSQVRISDHQKRLAIDLNFFINNRITYKKKDIRPYVKYWKSLSPNNYWGGEYKSLHDPVHFGRYLK